MTPAQDALIAEHEPLVRSIVRKVTWRGLPWRLDFEDLLQAGRVGLCEAARRWKPDTGVVFGAYARIRIHGAVIDCLRSEQYLSGMRHHHWKDTPVHQLDVTCRAGVMAEEFRTPTPEYDQAITVDELSHLVTQHPDPRVRFIVWAWLRGVPLKRVGARLRISVSRVSQLKELGMQQIREAIAA